MEFFLFQATSAPLDNKFRNPAIGEQRKVLRSLLVLLPQPPPPLWSACRCRRCCHSSCSMCAPFEQVQIAPDPAACRFLSALPQTGPFTQPALLHPCGQSSSQVALDPSRGWALLPAASCQLWPAPAAPTGSCTVAASTNLLPTRKQCHIVQLHCGCCQHPPALPPSTRLLPQSHGVPVHPLQDVAPHCGCHLAQQGGHAGLCRRMRGRAVLPGGPGGELVGWGGAWNGLLCCGVVTGEACTAVGSRVRVCCIWGTRGEGRGGAGRGGVQ